MSILNQINVSKIKKIEQLDILELKVDQGTEISKVKKLMENPSIEYAEPNYLIHMID